MNQDVIYRRQLFNADEEILVWEYTWWRRAGYGGVHLADPRRRSLLPFDPSQSGDWLLLKWRNGFADLSSLVSTYTDADNHFNPPYTGLPDEEDFWHWYYLPVLTGWSVFIDPVLYSGFSGYSIAPPMIESAARIANKTALKMQAEVDSALDAMNNKNRAIYNELLAKGFSPDVASSLSGYTGETK